MPTPRALLIELTERQKKLLEQIVRKRSNPHRLVQRAQIVLLAAEGVDNTAISKQINLHRHQVRNWRQRWQESVDRLNCLEQEGSSDEALLGQVIGVFSDEARPGGPAIFGVEQIVEIVAVACELPASSGRTISHWTPRELAEEVVRRGIVASISPRSVGRFLKGSYSSTASPPLLAQRSTARPYGV
jgi:putative transposase